MTDWNSFLRSDEFVEYRRLRLLQTTLKLLLVQ